MVGEGLLEPLATSEVVRVKVPTAVRLKAVGGGVEVTQGEVVTLAVMAAVAVRASVVVRVGVMAAVAVRASVVVRVGVWAAVAVIGEAEAEAVRAPLEDSALVMVLVPVRGGLPEWEGEPEAVGGRVAEPEAVGHRVADTDALGLTEPVTEGEVEALALSDPPQKDRYSGMPGLSKWSSE